MPRFEPFAGTLYDPERVDLAAVVAPPYDVIDEEDQARLESMSPWNSVRVELPREDAGRDRYQVARDHYDAWLAEGILAQDDEPAFYVYRMGFHDEAGRPRQTAGVIGALGLEVPGEGDVLPHERTMPKPKGDRLDLLRATRANLSPVWGLSLASGLSTLCELPGPPIARATDEDGVHHRLWRITQRGVVEAISEAVGSQPVVIADGHHRYETALAYQAERRAAGDAAGDHDLLVTYVVELADEQLAVRAIHRLVQGIPNGPALLDHLAPVFDAFETDPPSETIASRMGDAGALALVTPERTWLLRPRQEAFAGLELDLDSLRVERVLATFDGAEVRYQHGWDHVARAVEKGEAAAGFLLRPATVAQIADVAHARGRMPAKTTFFTPKPRTGMVFRRLDG